MKTTFTIIIMTGILNSCAFSQNLNTTLIGHWGYGPCNTVTESGNYAYIGSGCMFLVIDKSNIAQPVKVGELLLPDELRGIKTNGIYAFVADSKAGLRIVNISDPAAPFEKGYYNTPGNAHGVDVSGSYAYVADWNEGLRIINISNPVAPFEEGYFVTPGSAYSVSVSGSYAYVTSLIEYGLRIINISNPTAPFEEGYYDTPGSAQGVAVSDNYAYVADSWMGLRIINISNPAAPFEEGYYYTPGNACGVAVSDGYAYVAGWEAGMMIIKNDLLTNIPENEIQIRNTLAITFSPNPGASIINISCILPEKCEIKIEFYNQAGALLKKTIDNNQVAGQYSKDVDISELPAGAIFYSVWASAIKSKHIYRGKGKLIIE